MLSVGPGCRASQTLTLQSPLQLTNTSACAGFLRGQAPTGGPGAAVPRAHEQAWIRRRESTSAPASVLHGSAFTCMRNMPRTGPPDVAANRLPALSLLQGRAAVRTEQRGEAAAQGYRPLPYPTARAPDGRVHAVRVPAEGRERARVLQVPQLDAVVPAAAQEHAPPHRVPAQRVDLRAPGVRGRARGPARRAGGREAGAAAAPSNGCQAQHCVSQEDTEHTERAICAVNQNTRGRILGSVPFAGLALV